MLVFDHLRRPDAERSARLTRAARETNFQIRELGYLPFVGPAVSSVALALPPLLAGRETLASVFLDGIYFGMPVRLTGGVHPVPREMGPEVQARVDALFRSQQSQARKLGLVFGDT